VNLLTRNFYDNHIFYQCECDEKIYINLNVEAIELSSKNQFQTSTFKKDVFKRSASKDENVSAFGNLVSRNEELRDVEPMLNKLCEKLLYNYIVVKNYTGRYSGCFMELGQEIRQAH
jgi:hypothetical protein